MRTLIALALVAAPILSATDAPNGNSAMVKVNAAVQFYAPVTLTLSGSLDLGHWVINPGATGATLTFGNGQVTGENCVPYVSSRAKVFPTIKGTKDSDLTVKIQLLSSSSNLKVNPVDDVAAGTTFDVPVSGTWETTGAGSQSATITVTASYL